MPSNSFVSHFSNSEVTTKYKFHAHTHTVKRSINIVRTAPSIERFDSPTFGCVISSFHPTTLLWGIIKCQSPFLIFHAVCMTMQFVECQFCYCPKWNQHLIWCYRHFGVNNFCNSSCTWISQTRLLWWLRWLIWSLYINKHTNMNAQSLILILFCRCCGACVLSGCCSAR